MFSQQCHLVKHICVSFHCIASWGIHKFSWNLIQIYNESHSCQDDAFEKVFYKMSTILFNLQYMNSSPASATYMCQWNGSVLAKIMACCPDGAKPLSEPMLTYCQFKPKEYISMKFCWKFKYFHSRKCIWTCHLQNGSHFVQGEMN